MKVMMTVLVAALAVGCTEPNPQYRPEVLADSGVRADGMPFSGQNPLLLSLTPPGGNCYVYQSVEVKGKFWPKGIIPAVLFNGKNLGIYAWNISKDTATITVTSGAKYQCKSVNISLDFYGKKENQAPPTNSLTYFYAK